jgi:hypothetical protein
MSYSDMTLEIVRSRFGITMAERALFPKPGAIPAPPWLLTTLARGNGMALVSEKARNEFIVVPVLLTCRELTQDCFYIFSGIRFDIDAERGLKGECDFILSRTPPLPIVTAPVAVLVEAKRQDIEEGLGQCAAQMIAARIFNEREGQPNLRIGGCVTTGETWQFLSLEKNVLTLDSQRYYINEVDKLLWIVSQLVESKSNE